MKTSIIVGGLTLVISAAAFATASNRPVTAAELKPVKAHSLEIGGLRGVAYYTVEQDGYRIVATLADGEGGQPVRLVATLAPGQKLNISVPRAEGVLPVSTEIARSGDKLVISPAMLTQ